MAGRKRTPVPVVGPTAPKTPEAAPEVAPEAVSEAAEPDLPDPLARYRAKRTADGTPEPMGSPARRGRHGVFVVHEHKATRHHWDLRLEVDGTLVSWAVPRAPSMDPDDKRMAIKVETHPREYIDFEAVIPKGNYGAGPMIAWDRGAFVPLIDPARGLIDGEIKFELRGYKLRGAFTLVRTGGGSPARRGDGEPWLLIKKRDAWSTAFVERGQPLSGASVLSGLTVDELFAGAPRHQAVQAALAGQGLPAAPTRTDAFAPMLCESRRTPFTDDAWLFEVKYDGYRVLAHGGSGQAQLRYRSGLDASARFPELTSALRAVPVPGLVLDGEVVVTDAAGAPDFGRLQGRAALTRSSEIDRATTTDPVTLMVFDVLAAFGHDLRGLPLDARRALLAELVPAVGPLRLVETIPAAGEALFTAAGQLGLEGIIGKRRDSRYLAGRGPAWVKIKHGQRAPFAVCGFTPPQGQRVALGALHLCLWDGLAWRYAGKVGTGFSDEELRAWRTRLEEAPAWTPTFALPSGEAGSQWVVPEAVVEVEFLEWVGDDNDPVPRHPTLVRELAGKPPETCLCPHIEPIAATEVIVDAPSRELRISNRKKLFFPDDGITKGDLIEYYRAIAPALLPYLADRPTVITRFPDGIDGKWFYQKDMPDWVPPWLRTVALWSDHSQRDIHYVLVDDADGLAYLANLGSIPIHVWASRAHDLARPDWTIIDLDPKQAPIEHVVPLALAVHALCEQVGLPNYVKTSGQTGLHVLIPLGGQCTFEQARTLAYLLAMVVEQRHPTMATTHRNPAKRDGKVYLDWGQNAQGQLLVAPYSVRPGKGAPVSMPLVWDEVVPGLSSRAWTLRTALARLEAWGGDPVRPVLTERPNLLAALERLSALVGPVGPVGPVAG